MLSSVYFRAFAAVVSLVAVAGLVWGISLYPFGPWWPAALVLTYVALLLRQPHAWVFMVPAILPVIDQAKVSGSIFLTESDMLLTATIVAGFARVALVSRTADLPNRAAAKVSVFAGFLLLLLTVSYAIGAARGFLPYAPFDDQLGGYSNRWNSLRVAKGFLFPLVLLPLLILAVRERGRVMVDWLLMGMAGGLAGVCAVAVYERMAYAGLLNFSSDYRITGPFWEMHVGGAALDGWLALTLPFVAWVAFRTSNMRTFGPAMFLGGCAIYVSLVTFSRGVYGSLLVTTLLLFLLHMGKRTGVAAVGLPGAVSASGFKPLQALLVSIGGGLLIWAMVPIFHTGGYRALGAFVALLAATHFSATAARGCGVSGAFAAVFSALLFVALDMALYLFLDKGAYLAFGLVAVLGLIMGMRWLSVRSAGLGGGILGLWLALAVAGVLVAKHWGDTPAMMDFSIGAMTLAAMLLYAISAPKVLPVWTPRAGLLGIAVLGMLAGAIAVTGGYYMGTRFSTSQSDLGGRERHWREGFSWLQGDDEKLLGKGLGRFPETYYWNGPETLVPGGFAIVKEQKQSFLRLSSARHPLSWGDMLRLEQRLSPLGTRDMNVMFEGRAKADSTVYFEVCTRHLIYALNCHIATAKVPAGNGGWQSLKAVIHGPEFGGGPWYAPQSPYFALALESSAKTVEIANIRLLDDGGLNVLRNGDFSAGNDFWFFSSDRDHLPWHIKSVFMNLLFDQGALGLGAFVLLLAGVFLRSLRRLAFWNEAPYFIASVAAFLSVGLFDSLLDVPRLAVMFYLMCFLLLVIQPERFAADAAVTQKA